MQYCNIAILQFAETKMNYNSSARRLQHWSCSTSQRTHCCSLDLLGLGPSLIPALPWPSASARQCRSHPFCVHHSCLCSCVHVFFVAVHFSHPHCRQRFGFRGWPPAASGAARAPPPPACCGCAGSGCSSCTAPSTPTVGNFAAGPTRRGGGMA